MYLWFISPANKGREELIKHGKEENEEKGVQGNHSLASVFFLFHFKQFFPPVLLSLMAILYKTPLKLQLRQTTSRQNRARMLSATKHVEIA